MPSEQQAHQFINHFVAEAKSVWTALATARWRFATTGKERYKEEVITRRLQEHQLYEDADDWALVRQF